MISGKSKEGVPAVELEWEGRAFNPKVSIVIPVYNGADFLDQCIESALAQTYPNIEVLIVNDGSVDDGRTERIAMSFGDRVRYFRKPNGGVASALNMAINEMAGEFFSWLSHDDLYVKEKIEQQVVALSSIPSVDRAQTIFYGDFEVFTSDPERTTPVLLRGVPPEEFRYWITIESALHGCTLLIPKAAFVKMGGFNESLRTTQDYDLWFRMAEKFRFVHLPTSLVKARSHAGQGSVRMAGLALAECNEMRSRFVTDLTPDELLRSTRQEPVVAYAQIAAIMCYTGFWSAGRTAMRLSLQNFWHSPLRCNALAIYVILEGLVVYSILKLIKRIIPYPVQFAVRQRVLLVRNKISRKCRSLCN